MNEKSEESKTTLAHDQNVSTLTDCSKFKKLLAVLLDRCVKDEFSANNTIDTKITSEKDDFESENLVDVGLQDVAEETENDLMEFNIPESLKLAERKLEVFRSKPLLEMRQKITDDEDRE